MSQIDVSELFSQQTLNDPLSFYGRIREQEKLVYTNLGDVRFWIIATSYAETIELLKDPRLVCDRRNASAQGVEQPAYGGPLALFSQNMLGTDPPDHTRLRTLVSKAFTPRMIERLRPRIQQITDELLDAVQDQGHMDLIADFAYPLPITVISEMLGIPSADRQRFRTWTQDLLAFLAAPEKMAEGMAAAETFIAYIKALLGDKRAHPANDLTSDLVRVKEQGDSLSEQELVSMIFLLILGGHETTVNLLGNGVLTLLQHPEQLRLLQHNPDVLNPAVEELLRYTAPVSFTGTRWAREDIPLYGQVIRQGDVVRLSLCAADTDPQQFTDPQTLDITRSVNRHLAFSKGIHVCLGAPLARLEGQIAIGTLFQRFPHLHLANEQEPLSWNPVPYLRGLQRLAVAF
ncbi:cytochrome P450 [Ktedonosporobacter rubrisoli]|uniref:Cytochrome P450 n=1 Tax=Ktedonosporobacter rubrisoli TaxID=2509675 RepID=A0A4P6JKA2_KTERU|nr:cytochrome P450 [Ktedonosporobacter rubrisoli]QBD75392.1 cytochrome P450 [Ktedonosporobacter rubrisoli]